ncbi:MAG: glycosyl transferase family 2, partial [Gammaproteobacteria bacterium]|nr:glycosyl transferase family 2 [Gammaproteobacteria bacterium]
IVLMSVAFIVPLLNLAQPGVWTKIIAAASLLVMITTYLPTLNYYRLPRIWSMTLPLAGFLYLLMTCHSALLHVFGSGASWKGRSYGKPPIT